MAPRIESNYKWNFFRDHQRLKSVVRFQIERKGLTFVDAGKLCGVSGDTLSKYFRGDSRGGISNFELFSLCQKLGIDVALDIKFNESAI